MSEEAELVEHEEFPEDELDETRSEEEIDEDETELGLSDQVSFCRAVYDGDEPVWTTRDSGGSLPMLVGQFASYSNWNEIRSRSEARDMGLRGDRYMEKVLPGAFKKTLTERAGQIKVLFNHGTDPSIGKKPLGKIVNVTERDEGPAYEVKLYDTSYVRDLLPALSDGQFGSSYRSDLVKGRLRKRPSKTDFNPDGLPEATVSEIRLKEIGPVTFPAEMRATAGVRSITDWVRSEDLGLALRQMVHEEVITLEEEPIGLEDHEREETDDDAATLDDDEQPETTVETVRATAIHLGSSRRTRRQRTNYLSNEGVTPKWQL